MLTSLGLYNKTSLLHSGSGCFFSVALQMHLKREQFSKAQMDSRCRERLQLTYVTAYSVRNSTTVSLPKTQVREREEEGITH